MRDRGFPAGSSLLQLLLKLIMLCLAKPRKGHMQDSRSETPAHPGDSWRSEMGCETPSHSFLQWFYFKLIFV